VDSPPADPLLQDGDGLEVGRLVSKVIRTQGHTVEVYRSLARI